MGIGSFLKQGVQSMMIARPEDKHNLIVYKWPDRNIPMWSQLTVKSDEGCVFFRDGQLMGVVGAGRHTIDGKNLPFLNNWIKDWTNENMFLAELFFVRTQALRNDPVKFGGRFDGMIDPGTDMPCTPQLHGELAIRVMDPTKFIIGLIGQSIQPEDNSAILRWAGQRFMQSAEDVIAEYCNDEGVSLLEISRAKRELEQFMVKNTPTAFDEVGISLTELVRFSLKIPPAVRGTNPKPSPLPTWSSNSSGSP